MKFEQTYCVIDAEFRLLWTGGDWDEFARSNMGLRAMGNHVLTSSILSHIVDDETRSSIERMVQAVSKTQGMLRIDYRCDSPELMRRFRLTVQSMRADRTLMVHDLRDAGPFRVPLRPWRADQDAPSRKCSYCGCVDCRDGRWTAPDAMGADHPDRVAFTVCETCQGLVDDVVDAALTGRPPKVSVSRGFGPG